MARVYFTPIESAKETEIVSNAAGKLLGRLLDDEKIELKGTVPMKVHFGEAHNVTFIRPASFEGLISTLKGRGVETAFMETNALYKGQRQNRKDHTALAIRHGFTSAPIILADGDHGENYSEVKIDKKHYQSCKIGGEFARYPQMLVVSHFKGHMLAGFGGAIKQLAMGMAARGGKLEMHGSSRPVTNPIACTKCGICIEACPVDAISIGMLSATIDAEKCIGCAACISACPTGAMMPNFLATSLPNTFAEKLAEYAYAAQKDHQMIYVNYLLNITRGCDCMGTRMKRIAPDIGILVSTDAVAIDRASLDLMAKQKGKHPFWGDRALEYGEEIGLGSMNYDLVEV